MRNTMLIMILFFSTPFVFASDHDLLDEKACNETKEYMPATIYYANKILEAIFSDIKLNKLSGLGPDAKSQVTMIYQDAKPKEVDNVVISIQHSEEYQQEEIYKIIEA